LNVLSSADRPKTNQTLAGQVQQISQTLSLPQDSALTAPRLETESRPVSRQAKIYIAIHQASRESCQPDQLRHSWKNKLSGAQGQSFFWEPVDNDIPETELSQHKKLTGCPQKIAPHDQ
jgi:hypothetical protein